jgi:Peptidase family M41/C-terminal, D2-small domain, of ClpB protein/AAA domain (Cdc48 subfamily)
MFSFNKALIQQRELALTKAVTQLKKEFIGIDGIIEEVADLISPWWLFPENQMRPLIINLWGMTGSGKTELIKRLCSLLDYQNFLLRFDMGEFGSNSSFLKYTLTRQLVQFSGTSPVVLLDEFQFAKTKDEEGKEVNNTALRIIWDLLDSGELMYEPDGNTYYLLRAKKAIDILKAAEKTGAQVKNGIVIKGQKDLYDVLTEFNFGYQDSTVDRADGKMPFKEEEVLLSDIFCTGVYEINAETFTSWRHVQSHIKKLPNLPAVIDFLTNHLESQLAFKKMDLSKCLIFVVGNLDEAFSMSNNINPDIDADEFRRFTLKINIADIKTALQRRFRNEQIARLGNNHLVYHAFSNKNFEDLINMHLKRFATTVKQKFGIKVAFTKNVHKLVYSEGVFPTQGVRPVISTIRHLIESNISKIILHISNKNLAEIDAINWNCDNDNFEIDFFRKDKKVSTQKFIALQKINSLRRSTKSDLQAIVAVHEAGHTIAAIAFAHVLPEYIITRTVDSESNGFAYILLPEEIITKKLLKDQIRIGLGGYVAEQLVFGKESNTTGVSGDLAKITTIANQMARDYGMLDEVYKTNIHVYGGNSMQFTFTEALEKEAKQIVQAALLDVKDALTKHKPLLIEIAKYLSDNSRLNKPELKQMCLQYFKQHKIANIKLIESSEYYNYRNRLFKEN